MDSSTPMPVTAQCMEPEDNLPELVLSFYPTNPRDRTQIVRLGCRHPYPLSYLDGPIT